MKSSQVLTLSVVAVLGLAMLAVVQGQMKNPKVPDSDDTWPCTPCSYETWCGKSEDYDHPIKIVGPGLVRSVVLNPSDYCELYDGDRHTGRKITVLRNGKTSPIAQIVLNANFEGVLHVYGGEFGDITLQYTLR